MSRTVFILGAGASKEAGGPLMAEFLDTAEQLHQQNEVGEYAADFELVFKGRAALNAVQIKSVLDLFNIESVFGAFEMGRLIGRLGSLSSEEVDKLGPATRRVIATTLERSIRYPSRAEGVLPPAPYDKFARTVAELTSSRVGPVSVLTLNYDIALDYAFHYHNIGIDYRLSKGGRAGDMPVMKLHGSLNWTSCRKCNVVKVLDVDKSFASQQWRSNPEWGENLRLHITGALSKLEHCGKPCLPESVIVPPTWNKAEYQDVIARVWSRAAEELSDAENVVVMGYSLPRTDEFFQYLFRLGTVSDKLIRRFIVCDPDDGVAERCKELLANDPRGRLRHYPRAFSAAVSELKFWLGVE